MTDEMKPSYEGPVKRLIVYGAGGHGNVVAEIARLNGWHVCGHAVDPEYATSRSAGPPPALIRGDNDTLLEWLRSGVRSIALGVGDCTARFRISERLSYLGFRTLTLTHPSATVSPTASIGVGCVICAGAIVCPMATLGDGVIVNTCASVDHDCEVRSFCHISPGAHLAGCVKLGSGVWIGVGANVSDHRTIGFGTIVGAGSTVVRDLPSQSVAYGSPARVRRSTDGSQCACDDATEHLVSRGVGMPSVVRP